MTGHARTVGTLSGTVMAQSDFTRRPREQQVPFAGKDGTVVREKTDSAEERWLGYDGGPSGTLQHAHREINTGNVQQLAPAWMFPMPNSSRLEVTPVVVDGIMYVTGWNEVYALDATTGRQLWTYNEPNTEGILSEGGAGANRGAAISGDRVFAITDRAAPSGVQTGSPVRSCGTPKWDRSRTAIARPPRPLIAGDSRGLWCCGW